MSNYAEKSGPELAELMANLLKMSDCLKSNEALVKAEPQPSAMTTPAATTALQQQSAGQVQLSKDPVPTKPDDRIDFEKQYKPATWESLIDLAWYNGALAADKTGAAVTPIPAMFFGQGGKKMLEALRDPAKKNRVYGELLSHHIVRDEMLIQSCNSIIAATKADELAKELQNPNSLLHAAIDLKLKLENEPRNVMICDLKLRGISHSPINVERAGQVFIGHPQCGEQKQDEIRNPENRPLLNDEEKA